MYLGQIKPTWGFQASELINNKNFVYYIIQYLPPLYRLLISQQSSPSKGNINILILSGNNVENKLK